jgi:hypothetical protein
VSRLPMATKDSTGCPSLSEYEVIRARNIERNNSRLRSLGLISANEQQESNDAAWKRRPHIPDEAILAETEQLREDEDFKTSSDNRKRRRTQEGPFPYRSSMRLRGLEPDGGTANITSELTLIKSQSVSTIEVKERRRILIEECRKERQKAALIFAQLGIAQAAKENPTATYEHCLMRVRTMTEKALANRVKAIERAAGKHCVVKMAIFKSCLQDEGKWDLAALARDALERLKAMLPPPTQS